MTDVLEVTNCHAERIYTFNPRADRTEMVVAILDPAADKRVLVEPAGRCEAESIDGDTCMLLAFHADGHYDGAETTWDNCYFPHQDCWHTQETADHLESRYIFTSLV